MNLHRLLVPILACLCLARPVFGQDRTDDKQRIEQVLTAQAQAWNEGDVDAFMQGYAKIPGLRWRGAAVGRQH